MDSNTRLSHTHPSDCIKFMGPIFDDRISDLNQQNGLPHSLSPCTPDLPGLSIKAQAQAANKSEHKMSFLAACRLYPKAMAWSALLSMAIVMEGYGASLMNGFFAMPGFRQSFGRPVRSTLNTGPGETEPEYQISSSWQAGLINGAIVAEIVGLVMIGFLADRFGYNRTMLGSLVLLLLFVFVGFFALNIKVLLAAQILCGIPWGIFQTLSTTYAAEVVPLVLRAYLTANINMCWLVGQFAAVVILRGFVASPSAWSYRIPLALQWVWIVPILLGTFFAPESPWWLIRHGQHSKAKHSLLRLTRPESTPTFNIDETLAMLQHTNEVEKQLTGSGSGNSFLDCFRGTNLRRTEITCMVWVAQSLAGASVTSAAAYFYEQAGLSTENAYNVVLGTYAAGILGNVLSWGFLRVVGRRRLYLCGLVGLLIVLLVAGGIGLRSRSEGERTTTSTPQTHTSWALGVLIISLTLIYNMTLGPVCYVLVAEIPSSRLRIQTVILARIVFNISSVVMATIIPHMLNPAAWNWGVGKTCFLFAGTCSLCVVWTYLRLPEPRGLSYLELDVLFSRKARIGQFADLRRNLESMGYFSLEIDQGRNWGY